MTLREIQYFCPQCQGMELELHVSPILPSDGSLVGKASCSLCGWAGTTEQLIGAISPDNAGFWTSERIANVLLLAATKHAAGPMLHCLEFLGLAPVVDGEPGEQESAQEARGEIMRKILEAITVTAFQAAEEHALPHFKRYAPQRAEAVESIFGESYGQA